MSWVFYVSEKGSTCPDLQVVGLKFDPRVKQILANQIMLL